MLVCWVYEVINNFFCPAITGYLFSSYHSHVFHLFLFFSLTLSYCIAKCFCNWINSNYMSSIFSVSLDIKPTGCLVSFLLLILYFTLCWCGIGSVESVWLNIFWVPACSNLDWLIHVWHTVENTSHGLQWGFFDFLDLFQ